MTERDIQNRGDVGLPVVESTTGSGWGKAHHVLLGFLALAVLVWVGSGFYKVNADEVAIVERPGAICFSKRREGNTGGAGPALSNALAN